MKKVLIGGLAVLAIVAAFLVGRSTAPAIVCNLSTSDQSTVLEIPQQMVTIEELGIKAKEKWPEYNKYSDREVGEKILEKYPVYLKRIISE
jgi:hypothetical protein